VLVQSQIEQCINKDNLDKTVKI